MQRTQRGEDIVASLGSSETLYKTHGKYNAIESGRTLKTTQQKVHFFLPLVLLIHIDQKNSNKYIYFFQNIEIALSLLLEN